MELLRIAGGGGATPGAAEPLAMVPSGQQPSILLPPGALTKLQSVDMRGLASRLSGRFGAFGSRRVQPADVPQLLPGPGPGPGSGGAGSGRGNGAGAGSGAGDANSNPSSARQVVVSGGGGGGGGGGNHAMALIKDSAGGAGGGSGGTAAYDHPGKDGSGGGGGGSGSGGRWDLAKVRADLDLQTLDVERVLWAAVRAGKAYNVEAAVTSIINWVDINSKDKKVRKARGMLGAWGWGAARGGGSRGRRAAMGVAGEEGCRVLPGVLRCLRCWWGHTGLRNAGNQPQPVHPRLLARPHPASPDSRTAPLRVCCLPPCCLLLYTSPYQSLHPLPRPPILHVCCLPPPAGCVPDRHHL